ncbi:MAG: putative rane protein required for colicin production [Clostridiales bacterium]|nr:putative rane protein required for colicin production [Clostridiales bacterium]
MNWSDLLVVAMIGGFGLIGLKKGFIYSMFRLLSFFASAILSIKFYPLLSTFLMKTFIFTNIKASILKNLLLQQQVQTPKLDNQAKQAAAEKIVSNLQLPGFLKGFIQTNLPNPSSLIDMNSIMDAISSQLAKVVVDVISLIVLYIIIRIGLIFLRFIFQGVAKLPVFKQMDKLGGFAFGAVEGLLTIYIVFAVAMLFNTSPQFKGVFESIDNSLIAKFFYQQNFILNWMLPGGKIV